MITIGTFTRNTEPHQKCVSSAPPATGPIPTPSAETPAHTPIARARSLGERKTFDRMESVPGMMHAPPMPIIERVAMSTPADGAKAESTDPVPNTTRPKVRNL